MEHLLRVVEKTAKPQSIKKGTTILYQGEIPRHACIIKKGFVRAYTITSSGEERIVTLLGKGDVFPMAWLFSESRSTLFYYDVGTDVEVVCAPKQLVLDTIASSPECMQAMLHYTVRGYTSLLMRITALEQSNAAEKIALTLYYLMIRHGVERQPGKVLINLKLTQSTIASLVGLTRESTAVNIALLKKRGVITYRSFLYVVDKKNLENFIGEDNFKDVS